MCGLCALPGPPDPSWFPITPPALQHLLAVASVLLSQPGFLVLSFFLLSPLHRLVFIRSWAQRPLLPPPCLCSPCPSWEIREHVSLLPDPVTWSSQLQLPEHSALPCGCGHTVCPLSPSRLDGWHLHIAWVLLSIKNTWETFVHPRGGAGGSHVVGLRVLGRTFMSAQHFHGQSWGSHVLLLQPCARATRVAGELCLESDLVSEWTGPLGVPCPEQFPSGTGLEGTCSLGVVNLDVLSKLTWADCALRGHSRGPSLEKEQDFLMPQPCLIFTMVSGTFPGTGPSSEADPKRNGAFSNPWGMRLYDLAVYRVGSHGLHGQPCVVLPPRFLSAMGTALC